MKTQSLKQLKSGVLTYIIGNDAVSGTRTSRKKTAATVKEYRRKMGSKKTREYFKDKGKKFIKMMEESC